MTENKSKGAIKLYPLYLTILFLSLTIIIYLIGDYALFTIQYAYGTTTNYDRTVSAGQQVKINASKTSTSAGGLVEFTWTQISGQSVLGDNKTLKGPVLSIEPPVRPDPYTLGFVLTASKGQVTKSANVNVLVKGDLPPSAEVRNFDVINAQDICGENTNSLSSQKQIILNGNNSRDPEGTPLKYNWTQIGGPPVTISNPNSIRTTVNNDSICGLEQTSYLEFKLDVTDGVGQTRSDNVTIPVKVNQLPIARINAPNEVQSGQNFTSVGTASTDAEGPLSGYDWSITLNGESIGEENIPKSPIVDFTVPSTSINSTLLLQLRVKDSEGAQSKLTEKFIDVIPDYRPIANAGEDRFIGKGDLCVGDSETEFLFEIPTQLMQITLDGNNSRDPEGAPLYYNWTQIGGPPGQIVSENSGSALFSYDFCGITQTTNFNFKLYVMDSARQISSDDITITVGGY